MVLAPVGRDAELSVTLLRAAGVEAQAVPDDAALADGIVTGAGLAIVAEEALSVSAVVRLSDAVAQQPPWSDFPFLVFASPSGAAAAAILEALGPLGNVTLLDRPIGVVTLASAVRVALRARRHQYQVRDLLRALENRVQERDEFLAMLGHELRNPLGALMTAVEVGDLLARAEGEPARQLASEQRAIVRRQGVVLARLVDDLLDVSRVTSGKVVLQRSVVNLGELIGRAVLALRPQAEQAGLGLRMKPAETPIWVNGDATRLEQVATNLLQNALKYTPRGGNVDVELSTEGTEAVFAVRDTGVGIDAETLPHIFDLFQQASRTLDRSQGGLGIGLTLVRRLVELHGGVIAATSPGLGGGSTFRVRVPSVPAPATAEEAAPAAGSAGCRGREVLIVEDHADNREALAVFLEQLGHRVRTAADGLAGVEAILAHRPDVAIIDVGLPGIDGYEVARRVRTASGGAVCLIALTGYGRPEDRERARGAGFDLHMAKPVDFARLRRFIDSPAPEIRSA